MIDMTHRKTVVRGAAVAAATSLLLAGAVSGTARAADRPVWAPCPPPTATQGGGDAPGVGWECATLPVPLDYAHPGGKKIGLALIRHAATGPGKRIGSLIYNFGGPGGTGVGTLPGFGSTFSELNTRYDLVSFDPRGVGGSAPVRCFTGPQTDAYLQVDSTPDTPAEVEQFMDVTQAFAAACEKKSGALLPYLTTTNVARDLDRIRAAVGDKKLNYYGFSYGTELGGTYAHLFPKKINRAVLDGVMNPDENYTDGALYQLKGFQLALDNFAKACVAGTYVCPIHRSTPEQVEQVLTDVVAHLDQHPARTADGRMLNDSLALSAITQTLYSASSGWPSLARAVSTYTNWGDPTGLMALADSATGRDDKGRFDNGNNIFSATSCADYGVPQTTAQIEQALPAYRKASPLFGEQFAWALNQCTYWPVKGAMDHMEVSAKDAPPMLVVGNAGDPATPYGGAEVMARRLGKGVGVLLSWTGGQGHCSYGKGSACIDGKINDYLLNGKIPAYGTNCP